MSTSKIQVFDSSASDYDVWFEEEGRLIFASEVEALRQALPLLPKPWIEVGVGSGRFAQALDIDIGLDPSSELLKIARGRGISGLLGRGEEAPFKDASFGAIFLIATLCFIDSPERILSEASRLLKSGGKVLLGLVLKESAWGQRYQAKKESCHHFYRYATFHSHGEVDMLLKQAGFCVEQVISTLFQDPGKVNHIEPPREGFFADAGFTVILAGKCST
jgi:ubiquinone/menaquinone biosynthesis C-methylase UbiE